MIKDNKNISMTKDFVFQQNKENKTFTSNNAEVWRGLYYKKYNLIDLFEISNKGNLRNKKTKKIYSISKLKDGTCRVTVSLGSRESKLTIKIAIAVAQNFCICYNHEDFDVVEHLDMNPSNNNVENLVWSNRSLIAQKIEKMKKSKHYYGEENSQHKLTKKDVEVVKNICVPYHKKNNVKSLAREFGVSVSTISRIHNNEIWKQS